MRHGPIELDEVHDPLPLSPRGLLPPEVNDCIAAVCNLHEFAAFEDAFRDKYVYRGSPCFRDSLQSSQELYELIPFIRVVNRCIQVRQRIDDDQAFVLDLSETIRQFGDKAVGNFAFSFSVRSEVCEYHPLGTTLFSK